jgi:hypothetical protein
MSRPKVPIFSREQIGAGRREFPPSCVLVGHVRFVNERVGARYINGSATETARPSTGRLRG